MEMAITDILLALWFTSLFTAVVWAYFAGARRQLKKCVRYREEATMMPEREWEKLVDISRRFDL